MLSYAFQTLNQSNYEEIAAEKFEDMQNLFACNSGEGHWFSAEAGPVSGIPELSGGFVCPAGKTICREPSGTNVQKAVAGLRV